ncbi:MAG: hypothetical protein JEZ04_12870 [Spirochaetales bacterium]|nr:hypothetical protein [Spirochaetales bacterium]
MYRKSLFIIIIILIILSGCSDPSVGGGSSFEKEPVEITTLARGEILHAADYLEIEYRINDQGVLLNKLVITVTDSENVVINELVIEEEPLTEWVPPIEIDEGLPNGSYRLLLSFYREDELYYSEQREFFISDASYYIRSITSYPPVLYPGGGGLFYADIECPLEHCWLRWSLDGKQIASGMKKDGYQSIMIDAPKNEGVYELNLEVFPFPPEDRAGYDYKSTVIKSIPVYVNTNQKSGVNEFGPKEDFYSLFHFRGNLINSADAGLSGPEAFSAIGKPSLSVRNGVFGYSLNNSSGFKSDKLILPVEDGILKSFSLMFSVIPWNLSGLQPSSAPGGLFYSGSADGSFYLAVDALPDGQLSAVFAFGGEEYQIYSGLPLIAEDVYSSIGLAVYPEDNRLNLVWYRDGVPVAEENLTAERTSGVPAWQEVETVDIIWETRFAGTGGFEGLVDELGIYYQRLTDGIAVDPDQYRRSMELEYGKFLMYAEGFDGEPEGLIVDGQNVKIDGSRMIIAPGSFAAFPPIYPGYEEIIFTVAIAGTSTKAMEVVFYPDGQSGEIVRVDLSDETDGVLPVNFSLIFSTETVSVGETEAQDGETGFSGDFGGIVYRLINNDEAVDLEIESVLIIRKNINVSEAGFNDIRLADEPVLEVSTGVSIGS